MKKLLIIIFTFYTSISYAGWDPIDGWGFYNLFKQTNISAEEFYPFLRSDYATFYSDRYSSDEEIKKEYPIGNISLWKEILVNWSENDLEKAIYKQGAFSWSNKHSEIEQRTKIYLDFAQNCSDTFYYRINNNSWDYNEIQKQNTIEVEQLLLKANELLSIEKNPQLKSRYHYQIIRILHYSGRWQEAIHFYESLLKKNIQKNEIYYYIVDQVAGCYYSIKNYEKAAYLFTLVMNNSRDRKISAFNSYNMCTSKNADGSQFFRSIEDKKNFLLIKNLRNFSNEINGINEFLKLDPNDERIELLFMRALNNVERKIWPKHIGVSDKRLPFLKNENKHKTLLSIAESQIVNKNVKNNDFWRIASSYLSFMNQDIKTAKRKLSFVNTFLEQKKSLSIIYNVFSWNTISSTNENYIYKVLNTYPKQEDKYLDSQNDIRNFILDKMANLYYKNNNLAKAFLVHNYLETAKNISSIELLTALEKFYFKPNKSLFEKMLLKKHNKNHDFLEYINHQKGIYYLYTKNLEKAITNLEKAKGYKSKKSIPNTIFSNNIKECFDCDVNEVMVDEVYKTDVFSFIKQSFSRKELAYNLMKLHKLTTNEKQWKSKLANYLLANYYYNISNTGYYRGLLTDNTNIGDYIFINYANNRYSSSKMTGDIIIKNKKGYNLSGIENYEKHYFKLSNVAMQYYKKVINQSSDKELNARCTYLMAKCELNEYYNIGNTNTYKMLVNKKYNKYEELPKNKSLEALREHYSDTEFHKMIIKECSYYRDYSNYN